VLNSPIRTILPATHKGADNDFRSQPLPVDSLEKNSQAAFENRGDLEQIEGTSSERLKHNCSLISAFFATSDRVTRICK